jgi:hypothetical protein
MKIKKGMIASCIFIFLLLIFYLFHVKYFRVNVVFYAAIFDGLLASFLAGWILFKVRFFSLYNIFEKVQMVAIWVLLSYAFAISVPTVIDRSLSFYILEKLQQRGGGIRLSSFEDVFTKEYVKEHRLVDVRLTEQQSSGTIVIENGCVKLTKFGDQLATFSSYFRKNYLPKQRLLMGEYTDALTDPFRISASRTDYECD